MRYVHIFYIIPFTYMYTNLLMPCQFSHFSTWNKLFTNLTMCKDIIHEVRMFVPWLPEQNSGLLSTYIITRHDNQNGGHTSTTTQLIKT